MIKNAPSNNSLAHSLSTGYLQKKDEEIKQQKSQIYIDLSRQNTKIDEEEKQFQVKEKLRMLDKQSQDQLKKKSFDSKKPKKVHDDVDEDG